MTFSEVRKTAKACLQKYEPRLKVRGKKPYDNLYANDSLCVKHECHLRWMKEADIEVIIGSVLEALAELKDGFVMSGPRDTLPIAGFRSGRRYAPRSKSVVGLRIRYCQRQMVSPRELLVLSRLSHQVSARASAGQRFALDNSGRFQKTLYEFCQNGITPPKECLLCNVGKRIVA